MACTSTPLPEVQPREMTRCECAEISFEAVAHEMLVKGLSLDEVCRRTGCGQTCGACLPDLRAFIARRLR